MTQVHLQKQNFEYNTNKTEAQFCSKEGNAVCFEVMMKIWKNMKMTFIQTIFFNRSGETAAFGARTRESHERDRTGNAAERERGRALQNLG